MLIDKEHRDTCLDDSLSRNRTKSFQLNALHANLEHNHSAPALQLNLNLLYFPSTLMYKYKQKRPKRFLILVELMKPTECSVAFSS